MTLGVLAAAAASATASNDVEPGVLGFLVVAGIAVALVFLLRSMNKQFRKIAPRRRMPARTAPAATAASRTARPPRPRPRPRIKPRRQPMSVAL